MNCPRCGFPSPSEPCRLCGQGDFNQFEMARFSEESKPRLEFTLITSAHTIDPSSPLHSYKGPMSAITEDIQPRRFFFFPDQQSAMLFDFLRQITSLKDWSVLVNGRIRPYSQELWLPLLEMAELS